MTGSPERVTVSLTCFSLDRFAECVDASGLRHPGVSRLASRCLLRLPTSHGGTYGNQKAGRAVGRVMKALVLSGIVFLSACASPTASTLANTVAPSPSLIGGSCPTTAPPNVPVTPPPPAATGPNAGLVFRADGRTTFLYGNDALVVALPVDGTLHPNDPNVGLSSGVKFGWDRLAHGNLNIATRRLDAATSPVAADVPGGYGDTGFQVSGLRFPAPGCWEVSGTVAGTTLTFVMNVAAR